MTIPGLNESALEMIVERVLQNGMKRVSDAETVKQLMADYGLTIEDAAFACERTFGGMVRAATRSMENCPSRDKDPIAWISFNKCLQKQSIIAAIRPEFAQSTAPAVSSATPKKWWQRIFQR